MDHGLAVIRAAVARARRIETACESALQGGTCGVIVDGDAAWVDWRVPYGHLYDVSVCGVDDVDWDAL